MILKKTVSASVLALLFALGLSWEVLSSPNQEPIPGLNSFEESEWRKEIGTIQNAEEDLENQYEEETEIQPYSSEDGGIEQTLYDQAFLALESGREEWKETIAEVSSTWSFSFSEIERLEGIVRGDLLDDMNNFLEYLTTNSFSTSIVESFSNFRDRVENLILAKSPFGSIAQEIASFLKEQARLLSIQMEAFRGQVNRESNFSDTLANSDSNYSSDFINDLKRFLVEGHSSNAPQEFIDHLNNRIIGLSSTLVIDSLNSASLTAFTPDHLRQTQWNQDHNIPFVEVGGSFTAEGESFRFYKRNDWLVWGVFFVPVQTTLPEADLHISANVTLKDKTAEANANLFETYRNQVLAEASKWENERMQNATAWDTTKTHITNEKANLDAKKEALERSIEKHFRERKIALEKAKEEKSYLAAIAVLENDSLQTSSEAKEFFQASASFTPPSVAGLSQIQSDQSGLVDGLTRISTIQEMETQTTKTEKDTISEYIQSLRDQREFKSDTALSVQIKFQKDGECLDNSGRIRPSCKAEYEANTVKSYASVELSNGKIVVSKQIYSGESKFNGGDATDFKNYEAGNKLSFFTLELPSQSKRVDLTENGTKSLFSRINQQEIGNAWKQFGSNQQGFASDLYKMESSQAWSSSVKNINERNSFAYNSFLKKTEEAIEIQTVINQLIEHVYKGGTFKAFTKNFQEQKIIQRASEDISRSSGVSQEFVSSVLNGVANERAKKIAERKARDRKAVVTGLGAVTAVLSIVPGVNVGAIAAYSAYVAAGVAVAVATDQVANGGKITTRAHKDIVTANDYLSAKDLQADLKRADYGGHLRALVEGQMKKGAAFEMSQASGLSAKDLEILLSGSINEKERKKQKEKAKIQKGIQAAQAALYVGSMFLAPGLAPSLQSFLPTMKNIANMSLTAVDYARLTSLALSTASGSINGGSKGALGAMVSSISLPIPTVGTILPNVQWNPNKKTWNMGFQMSLANSNGMRFGADGSGNVSFEKDLVPSNGGKPISLNFQTGNNYGIGVTHSIGGGNSVGVQFGNQGIQFQGEFSPDANNFAGVQIGFNGDVNLSYGAQDIEFLQMQGNLFSGNFQGGLATNIAEQIRNQAFRQSDATDYNSWKDVKLKELSFSPTGALSIAALSSISLAFLSLAGAGTARLFQNQADQNSNSNSRPNSNSKSNSNPNPNSKPNSNSGTNKNQVPNTYHRPISSKVTALLNFKNTASLDAKGRRELNEQIKSFTQEERLEWRSQSVANSSSRVDSLKLLKDIDPVPITVKVKSETLAFQDNKIAKKNLETLSDLIERARKEANSKIFEPIDTTKLDELNQQKKDLATDRELSWSKLNGNSPNAVLSGIVQTTIPTDPKNLNPVLTPEQKKLIEADRIYQRKLDTLDRSIKSESIKIQTKMNIRLQETQGIGLLKEWQKNEDLVSVLDPKARQAIENYYKAEEKYKEILNKPTQKPEEVISAKRELNEAMRVIRPQIEVAAKIANQFNSPEGKLENVVREIKTLTAPDSLIRKDPAIDKTVYLPVYQDQVTGAIQLGAGITIQDYVQAGAEHNQGVKSAGNERAKEIADLLGVPLSNSQEIQKNWCVAFSCWTLLRAELGSSVVPEFKGFVKSMVDSGHLNKETMYFENTQKGINMYAAAANLNYTRELLPRDRNESYSTLASRLQSIEANSITLRVKDDGIESSHVGHTISLVKNPGKSTWTVIDTGNASINGTEFDPANWENSKLVDPINSPYKNNSPYRVDFLARA